jgi:hypothetical protein
METSFILIVLSWIHVNKGYYYYDYQATWQDHITEGYEYVIIKDFRMRRIYTFRPVRVACKCVQCILHKQLLR